MNKQNTLRENKGSIFSETQREMPLDQRFKNWTKPAGSTGLIGNRTLIRSGY